MSHSPHKVVKLLWLLTLQLRVYKAVCIWVGEFVLLNFWTLIEHCPSRAWQRTFLPSVCARWIFPVICVDGSLCLWMAFRKNRIFTRKKRQTGWEPALKVNPVISHELKTLIWSLFQKIPGQIFPFSLCNQHLDFFLKQYVTSTFLSSSLYHNIPAGNVYGLMLRTFWAQGVDFQWDL